jgi:hypothetical protein
MQFDYHNRFLVAVSKEQIMICNLATNDCLHFEINTETYSNILDVCLFSTNAQTFTCLLAAKVKD